MMKRTTVFLGFTFALAIAQPLSAQQQRALAVAGIGQGYSFAEGIATESAMLLITPVAFTAPITRQLTLDLYSAYARGEVKFRDGATNTLQGIVDTRIRASLAATPWAVISASVNLPTGNATHDSEEAIVANALSSEILGFREALWGTGFGFTTGIATASRFGETGVGFGASYRVATEFEPSAEEAFKYTPGNEARARLAIDRNIGANKLTAGVTFQNYSDDKVDGRNLFAPGNRWRADVTYSFRTSPTSTWTLFFTDVRRENGDVTLRIVDPAGNPLSDSTFQAGQQNLAVGGLAGATRIGSINMRPSVDVRLLTRESGTDEGWLAGFGSDFPIRRGRTDIVPSVRFNYGQLEGATDDRHAVYGGELGLTLRWGGAR